MSKKQKNLSTKPIDSKNFDTSIRPQDDFYRYVNGTWFKKNTIPATENRWGGFQMLARQTKEILHTLLKELSLEKTLDEKNDKQKLHDLYLSAMDMQKRNKQKQSYLEETFDVIDAIAARNDITEVLAHLHLRGVDAPWSLWFDQDDKNSTRMVMRIAQGGLGVPDRDYYLKSTKENKRILDAYKKYVLNMLTLEGFYKKSEISNVQKTIVRIERQLAKASMDRVDRRDAHKVYNKYTVIKLQKLCPALNWNQYLDILQVPKQARNHLNVDQITFLKECDKLFQNTSIKDIKIFLRWHFLNAYAGTLGQKYLDVRFEYTGKAIQGLTKMPERWKTAVGTVNALMPDALGKLYVEKYFSKDAKKKINLLVKNLVKTYRKRIKQLDWMSEKTKEKALKKLNTMKPQLGYPDKWQSYSELSIDTESFTKNVMEATIFDFLLEIKKLNKPTDPNEWHTSAPTVNAYYSPNLNQITFPAGILQPPFFYADGDDALNYGAIGYVIGHEMTHGFDDSGSKFDEFGNLNNWWTKNDKEKFKKKTSVLVTQFDAYKVVGGIRVNGKLTLGENIADLGGMIIAYEAFQEAQKKQKMKTIDGLTPNQRFFIGSATAERELVRDEFLKFATLNDPHSPTEFRVNGPLSNFDAFYENFDLKEEDKLYRKPSERARIW